MGFHHGVLGAHSTIEPSDIPNNACLQKYVTLWVATSHSLLQHYAEWDFAFKVGTYHGTLGVHHTSELSAIITLLLWIWFFLKKALQPEPQHLTHCCNTTVGLHWQALIMASLAFTIPANWVLLLLCVPKKKRYNLNRNISLTVPTLL